MSWITVAPLVLVWWNTSLSPPIAKRRATDADLKFVVEQIRLIRQETAFDILALGEVSSTDLKAIIAGAGEPPLALYDATDRSSKPMFDTAVIYDPARVSFERNQSIIDSYARTTLKTGEVAIFRTLQTGELFQLVVSHWPSRLTAAEHDPRRAELATGLRRSLASIQEELPTPYTILMGDYNDDPFSPSLANHLLATRDRSLARRDSRYFYNPFWKWIGESHHDVPDAENSGICGTHFYPGGESSRWFTYDQIIFSSAFLADNTMVLREQQTGILVPPELRARLLARREIFDHLPVLGTVDLRSKA
ncbi:hypothetical protein LJR022_000141 [Paraburkholderia hospita]|uniref:endonuclease/exonuclease/phosphatase family protein n=1 Tax=Paraburkholderia hospita TaxID=169430 RepID=UPI003ECE6462